MAKSFVFLRITDPEISALICGIRTIAMAVSPKSGPHITIRGPYSRPVPRTQLLRYGRLLASHPLVLEGVDAFQANDHSTVYLKVQHPKLLQVWWKPDYPTKDFGFNPHITLYEGADSGRAHRLLTFLRGEGMKLLTNDFAVSPYVSDHGDLFPLVEGREHTFLKLINRGLVRADVLDRLERTLRNSRQAA
jgi:hypothetical protein